MGRFSCERRRFLGGQGGKFLSVGLLRSDKQGDEIAAVWSEYVTLGAWDFANDSMSAEKP